MTPPPASINRAQERLATRKPNEVSFQVEYVTPPQAPYADSP